MNYVPQQWSDLDPAYPASAARFAYQEVGIKGAHDRLDALPLSVRDYGAVGDGEFDDSAAIQAALNTAKTSGGVVRGTPGRTYLISAPLVAASGTTLDMTGCTIRLKAGSGSGTMLANAAVTAQRSVADGAMTSGSATLTSATAAFTSADIGRTAHVAGAAAFGQLLVANITAVSSATSATLSVSAGTTVSAAAVSIYSRDTGIAIIGGTWDKQHNDGTGSGRHTMVLRHVDNLVLRGLTFKSTAGKYQLSIGGWTNLCVEEIRFPSVQSDGVHLHGPGRSGLVRGIYGTTGDDLVSLTPQDWADYNDIQGDITDVAIENVYPRNGGVRAVNIIATRSTAVRNIRVRNMFGSLAGTAPAVHIGDDAPGGGPEFAGGTFDNISIENISTTTPTNIATVLIDGTAMGRVRVAGLHFDNSAVTGTAIIDIAPGSAATIRALSVESLSVKGIGGQPLIRINLNTTVSALVVDKVDVENPTNTAWNCVFVQGTVTDLVARNVVGNAGNGGVVNLDGARAAAAVTRCSLANIHLKGVTASAMVVATANGHTLPVVEVAGAILNNMAWVADLNTATELHLSSVSTVAPYGIVNVRANASVIVRGAGLNLGGAQGVQVTAGGVLRSKTLDLACDVSKLTKTAGDLAYNTNATLSCGAGPVVTDGTTWKHLHSGLTY